MMYILSYTFWETKYWVYILFDKLNDEKLKYFQHIAFYNDNESIHEECGDIMLYEESEKL